MSESPEISSAPPHPDALTEVTETVLRNRVRVARMERRAQTLLDEMRSLAPAAAPPRGPVPAAPVVALAASLPRASTPRPVAAARPRYGRRLGLVAGALLAVTLAVWLVGWAPLGIRDSGTATNASGEEMRESTPAAAATETAPAATAVLTRSLDSACVTPDRRPCDGVTLGLWRGDLAAWQALAAQQRLPVPDADSAHRQAIELRLEMGDPATRVEVARRSGLAAPLIGVAWFHATGTTHDVEVELRNLGAASADLGGAELVTERGDVLLRLPSNASLPAGIRCRISTRPAVSNPCDFSRDAVRRQSPSRPAALILRAPTGETLDYFDTAGQARAAP